MSGSDDRTRTRGAVPPPPSDAPDDAPEAIEVPRMEPPPPSLEAMVQSRPAFRRPKQSDAGWFYWVLLIVLAVAIAAYLVR